MEIFWWKMVCTLYCPLSTLYSGIQCTVRCIWLLHVGYDSACSAVVGIRDIPGLSLHPHYAFRRCRSMRVEHTPPAHALCIPCLESVVYIRVQHTARAHVLYHAWSMLASKQFSLALHICCALFHNLEYLTSDATASQPSRKRPQRRRWTSSLSSSGAPYPPQLKK